MYGPLFQALALANQLEDLGMQMDIQAIMSMLRACSSGHMALQFFRRQEELNSEVAIALATPCSRRDSLEVPQSG
jgi:hypothetical protein